MKLQFLLDPKGSLKLWDWPDVEDSYVIGGDVGDGISGGDPSCAQIISLKRFKQVAVWHGMAEPYEFGRILSLLGYFYNGALLVPESNRSGIATLSYLRKAQYPNIYKMKIQDTTYPEETERLGWNTNPHTRVLMIDMLRNVVKENTIILLDPDTLDELKTTVKNPDNGKIEASPGNHDDRMIALAIAVFVALELRESVYLSSQVDSSYLDRFRRQDEGYHVPLGRGGY